MIHEAANLLTNQQHHLLLQDALRIKGVPYAITSHQPHTLHSRQ